MTKLRVVLATAVLATCCLTASPRPPGSPIPTPTGPRRGSPRPTASRLHADVLRPKGATDADKTPVILSIGPYFNHSGQTGPAGPAEGTSYDPVGPNAGPSERFQDFVEGSGLLKKGYTLRDGRPARLRRLERLPRLVGAR